MNYNYSEKSDTFDNIEEMLTNLFGKELITNRDNFLKVLNKETHNFKPLGKLIGTF